MASFDMQSGVRGAAAGTAVYPGIGTVVGFVIGGFVGGHKNASAKKKLKKKQKRYEKAYKTLTAPKHLADITSQFRPLFREKVLTGEGPQVQSDIESTLARGGFEGTGIGAVGKAISGAMPDALSFNYALAEAGPQWQREIDEFNRKAGSENIGWRGQKVQKQDPFGSAGGLVDALGSYGSMGGGGAMGGGGGGGGMGGIMSMFGGGGQGGMLGGNGGYSNPYLGSGPGPEASGYWGNQMMGRQQPIAYSPYRGATLTGYGSTWM